LHFAQNGPDVDLLKRGQGLILDTEEDLAGVPRTPEYRAFLPERVDLSDRCTDERPTMTKSTASTLTGTRWSAKKDL
jgi:hypothetical protein